MRARNYKIIFLSLIFWWSNGAAEAQQIYQYMRNTDAALFSGVLVTGGVSQRLRKKHKPLDAYEVMNLSKADIFAPDKSAVRHYSANADLRSDFGFFTTLALAGANSFFLPVESASAENTYLAQASTLGMMWLQTNLLTAFTTEIVKNLAHRPRPYTYNPEVGVELKTKPDARKSFLSGHTGITAANSFFLAYTFSSYYPESKFKPAVWSAAALMPAWVGLERYLAGKHFPTDIVAGYALGAGMAWAVHAIHYRANSEQLEQAMSADQLIWIRYRVRI